MSRMKDQEEVNDIMKRGSGILLHITSLPSPYGIGDFGSGAYRFADFLERAGQSYWQVLPFNPTETVMGNSPYSSSSAFAGNKLFIDPEGLVREGFLTRDDMGGVPAFGEKPFFSLGLFPPLADPHKEKNGEKRNSGQPARKKRRDGLSFLNDEKEVDFEKVASFKEDLLGRAYNGFLDTGGSTDYDEFCHMNTYWLDDFALFTALKDLFKDKTWNLWPEGLRDREPLDIGKMRETLKREIGREMFHQYLFHRQWSALKGYCNDRGIRIIGDIPMYVSYDSSDVWSHPWLFKLAEDKKPECVAGVPPDYFSKTGQRWGNPVYRWEAHGKDGYDWWLKRLTHNLGMFDMVRIDHFRGFAAYWEVKASERTAVNGTWVKGPGENLLNAFSRRFPSLPIIAEDLGVITDDVSELMDRFGFPGMSVLQFAFGKDLPLNRFAPHNHRKNSVVYTGTHDNNTIKGWFEREAGKDVKRRLSGYLGEKVTRGNVHWKTIRLAMMSVADGAVIPMQDLLGLGSDARMNRPGSARGNWKWRVTSGELDSAPAEALREMTIMYGRSEIPAGSKLYYGRGDNCQ